jgi:capsular polysaccharide biosynthesis protein
VKRTLEIVFTHKRLLIAPLLAALIGTAGYVLLQPPSYQSTGSLWVNTGGVGTQSPAQTQADILSQDLKTSPFAIAVADAGPLDAYLTAHPGAMSTNPIHPLKELILGASAPRKPSSDELKTYLGTHVTVATVGPNQLTVTVTAPTPEVARDTTNALIAQLLSSEVAAKIAPMQTNLALYQKQAADQKPVVEQAVGAVQTYISNNHINLARDPNAAASDPTLAVLQAASSEAQATYSNLLTAIDKVKSDIASAQQPNLAPFRVVDSPQLPSSVVLGKTEIIAIAAGLFAGLLAMAVMAALLVRLDTTIHTADEVQRMVGLPVLGSTPQSAST